jgi:hypothetical protein
VESKSLKKLADTVENERFFFPCFVPTCVASVDVVEEIMTKKLSSGICQPAAATQSCGRWLVHWMKHWNEMTDT